MGGDRGHWESSQVATIAIEGGRDFMGLIRNTATGLLLAALAACSPTPYPGPQSSSIFGFGGQDVLGGAAHWHSLADETAAAIAGCLTGRASIGRCASEAGALKGKAVYLDASESAMPFGRAFHLYLMDALLGRGVAIATDRKDAILVATSAQLLHRDGKVPVGDFPGTGAALASGIVLLDFASAGLVALGGAFDYAQFRSEFGNGAQVVISTALFADGRHVMRRSTGYFIADADRSQFVSNAPPAVPPPAGASAAAPPPVATFKIVQD